MRVGEILHSGGRLAVMVSIYLFKSNDCYVEK